MDIKEKINLKRLNSILKKNTLTIIILVILFAIGGYFYSFGCKGITLPRSDP